MIIVLIFFNLKEDVRVLIDKIEAYVKFVHKSYRSKTAMISSSLVLSKAAVASSSIKHAGSFISALAIAILARCPPDSWQPPTPT